MPAACATDLREELLARVWVPTARAASRQDAELAAELAALEAAGDWGPPADWEPPATEELCGPDPDPDCGPPDGIDAWLADLPSDLLAEYLAATEDPRRDPIAAGRLPRLPGGCGVADGRFADGRVADGGFAGGGFADGRFAGGRFADGRFAGGGFAGGGFTGGGAASGGF